MSQNNTTTSPVNTSLAPGKKRLVLTSVNQVLTLVRNVPAIADKVTKFKQLSDLPMSEAPKKSCNCGSKQNFTTPDVGKQRTENVLNSLTPQDYLDIKSVLTLDQLCYYKRADGKLELVCI